MKNFLVFVVAGFGVWAQNSDNVLVEEQNNKSFYSEKGSLLIGVAGDLEANSDKAINNTLVNSFVFKNQIADNQKNSVYDRLRNFNSFAAYGREEAFVKYKLKKNSALVFSASNTDLFNSVFREDMFKLIFNGNEQFAGNTAHLSGTKFGFLNYQTFGLGYEIKLKNHILGLGLNYVSVGQYQSYEIERGDLFTAADGTNISFDGNVTLKSAGTDGSRFLNNIGSGAALNLSYFYKSNSERFSALLTATDLGFSKVKSVTEYHKDSTYSFNGIEVQNLSQFNTDEFTKIHSDSIYDILNLKKESKTETIVLPFKLKAGFKYDLSSKFSALADLQYIYTVKYFPSVTLGTAYKLCNRFTAIAKVSAGGFGRVDSYLGFNTLLPGKVNLYVSANALENIIAPTKTSGTSVRFSLSRIF